MERDIATLLAQRDIQEVIQRYCHAMDAGDEATWVDCFTADAVFDVRKYDGALVHREDGRADLERYIATYPKPPNFRKHVYSSHMFEIDVDSGRAEVRSYWTLMASGPEGGAVLAAFGTVRDKFVRSSTGWRIAERYAVAEAL